MSGYITPTRLDVIVCRCYYL